jgi:HAD superfamily hydrolase (TIGR01509 family)
MRTRQPEKRLLPGTFEKEGVTSYESSVNFIKKVKALGLRTAIISASRNAGEVLEASATRGLFDVKVDGVDSAELHLKGKPDPAIFLEAARRLNVKPEEAVVVEDALAGVEAGRRGKFRLVIGVDRTGLGEELKKHGADIVVRDLSELKVKRARSRRTGRRKDRRQPSRLLWQRKHEIFQRSARKRPPFFWTTTAR